MSCRSIGALNPVQRCARLSLSVAMLAAIPALVVEKAGAGGDCSPFPCGLNGNKVLVCHAPPGNPANAHTICISPNAVPAHLGHHPGDHCGDCAPGGTIVYAGDVSGDGFVGVADLLQVIVSWGACPQQPEACPGDLDVDGSVDIADFLLVLMNWD
jgi:hypothetical protein